MSQIKNEREARERAELAHVLTELFHDAPYSQEAIADATGKRQSTVSRWFSYAENELPDLHSISKFPREIRVPLCQHLVKEFGLVIAQRVPVVGRLNGSLDDELLNVDVVQAEIIRQKNKDPKAAKKYVSELRAICDKMTAECDKMLEAD